MCGARDLHRVAVLRAAGQGDARGERFTSPGGPGEHILSESHSDAALAHGLLPADHGTYAHLRRPLHAAAPRPAARPTHETSAHHAPVQDITPIEPVTGGHEQPNQTTQASVLQALNRAGRLTFDALLLFIFAPVIAVWWLNEKQRRRLTRD